MFVISKTSTMLESSLLGTRSRSFLFLDGLFQLCQFIWRKYILFIAEMTDCFCTIVFFDHFIYFLYTYTGYRSRNTVPGTFTMEIDRHRFKDVNFFTCK